MNTSECGPAGTGAETFKNDLRNQVDALIDNLVLNDTAARRLDAAATARSMIAAIPTLHPFDKATGPFYDTAGLTAWLGVSRQALAKRVHAGTLLAADLADGTRVYPAWQFAGNGHTHPQLAAVWRILRDQADAWTAMLWLTADSPALDGASAADWLTAGRAPAPVEAAAHADATRWAA